MYGKRVAVKLSGSLEIIRRRNNYPGWVQVGQKFEKKLTVPKNVVQYREYPIPDLNTLRDILCPKLNAIGYLDTLHKLYPF